MIKITDESTGVIYQLKNEMNELSIDDLETITDIMNQKMTPIEKYVDVFCYLGLEELMDNVDTDTLFEIIKHYNEFETPREFAKTIEIDGYTYQAYDGDEFVFKGRDMALIEKMISKIASKKEDNTKYLAEIMAVLFKRVDLSNNEHKDEAHIKFKAELFRTHVKANTIIPYIALVGNSINKQLIKTKQSI